jgi:hypothetical protein
MGQVRNQIFSRFVCSFICRFNRAYEVLTNDEKRRVYDQQGEEGLKRMEGGRGGGGGDPFGSFFDFFGGGGGRREQVLFIYSFIHLFIYSFIYLFIYDYYYFTLNRAACRKARIWSFRW